MTIDGESIATPTTVGIINPATEETVAPCPICTDALLDQAVESAERAFRAWGEQKIEVRRAALKMGAKLILQNIDDLAMILTLEQGKPLQASRDEFELAARWIETTADFEIPTVLLTDDDKYFTQMIKKPIGVVGAITPWNFPITLAAWKIASGLLCGNTIIVKPSPYTPLSTLRLGQILQDAFPPGVLNVISGLDSLGEKMVEHSGIRKISFTGSSNVGKKILRASATEMKRVTLELGGNDPAIILADVDPKQLAERLFWSAFRNCGQICVAIKRLYVHESIFKSVVKELCLVANSAKVGNGLHPNVQIGPINNKMQLDRVIGLVEDAKSHGATVMTGGARREGRGYFFPPTILTGVGNGVRVVDEEQFGPVLPVIPFRELNQVIDDSNASHFGLGSSIWSANIKGAEEIGRRLDCGTVWINHHGKTSPLWPFGGTKWSGLGHENGWMGLENYLQSQVISTFRS